MKIKPHRLSKLLKTYDFWLQYVDKGVYKVVYTRKSSVPELFENITIHCGGRKGEFAPAFFGCSIVPGYTQTGRTVRNELLVEVAGIPDKGITEIRTDEQAMQWEELVAKVAPGKAREFALSEGSELLEQTKSARKAVTKYCTNLDQRLSIEEQFKKLSSSASKAQKELAARITRTPAVMLIPDGWSAYDVASLSLVLFEKQLEIEPKLDRYGNLDIGGEMYVRIQILASKIANERGWEF